MWRWIEHYGMTLCFFFLCMAVISFLFGAFQKKSIVNKGGSKAPGKSRPAMTAGAVLSCIALLLAFITAVSYERKQSINDPGPFKFGSGWLFYGYYDQVKKTFLTGPYAKITSRHENTKADSNVPNKEDQIEVIQPSKIYIAYYEQLGGTRQYDCPITVKSIIQRADETGVLLEPGAHLVVKDVFTKAYTLNGVSIWARVEKN